VPPEDPSNVIPFPSHRRVAAQAALPLTDHEGERVVTLLMAALRGWEQVLGELGTTQARVSLGRSTSAALEVLGDAGALAITVDGDPVSPAISCEFEGVDPAQDALRAAVSLRRAVASAQSPAPPEQQFRVGMGMDHGTIVTVQASEALSFDAVGTMRMVAEKLRDFAGPGQVFLTRRVLDASGGIATAQQLGDIRINIHGEIEEAFSLTGIDDSED
jgi:class 3 adenylate cyclase